MFKRISLWIALVFIASYVLYGVESYALQRQLADKTVRLHVIANSDSEEDQALKLAVRDAVLEVSASLTANCTDAEEAKAVLGENLSLLEQTAKNVLTEQGRASEVRVSLQAEKFDIRYYDTFTMPAGEYPALCVRIGKAEGKNWWCVVFPSLCTAAGAEEFDHAAEVGGFTDQEQELMEQGEEGYILRFKTLEWIRKLTELFS